MMRRIARDPRSLPFVLSLIAALLIVPEMPTAAVRPTAGWRGWYLLLYREEAAHAVEAALPVAAPGSVSRTTAPARLDAFSGIETLPVAALEARLDPLDPRADAWLKGVGGYFQAMDSGPVAIAYVPATRGRMAAWRRLARSLANGAVPRSGWRLLELELPASLSVPLAALLFALAVAGWLGRRGRRGMLLATAGVLAWLPCLVNGGLPDLCVCCISLYLWLPRALDGARHGHGSPSSRHAAQTGMRIGVLLCAAAAAIAAGDAAVYRVSRMGASVLCLELLGGTALLLGQLREPFRRARALFEPVPIRAPRTRTAWVPLAAALAAGLLVTVSAGVSRLEAPLPRVAAFAGAGSRAGLEAAARSGDADRLPGLAEALGHAASLQTIALGAVIGPDGQTGNGSLPLPTGEKRLRLREYAGGGAGASLGEAPRTVVRFGPDWLERVLAGFGPGTVERLLIDQGRAVDVRRRAPWTVLLQAVPAALACLVLFGAPLAGPSARRRLMRLGLWAITEPAGRRSTE